MDANPYATPRVELVEQGIPDAFRRRWTPAQLRILAWLCLASIAGGVVLMVLSLLEAFGDGAAFGVYADWLGLLLSLLGAYLLLRLKHLVESRFRGPSLAWPVWLSILLTLLGEGWSLLAVTDDALQGWNWQALVYFALLALIGATTLWLGLRLLKQENLYPSLRIMAWLDIAGGAMLASVLLLVLAVLPLLAATVAMALACWRAAREGVGAELAGSRSACRASMRQAHGASVGGLRRRFAAAACMRPSQGAIDRQPAGDRFAAGFLEAALEQPRLLATQRLFQPHALGGEAE